MHGEDSLVYFLEEDTVSALLPDWPAEMQVAVYLTAGGGCDLAVHHRDEVARVLDRIAALHTRCRQDLCVVPQIEGHKTRKVLFSQEQQLLSLIADNPHLAEMASGYAANFRHAGEQGLDADTIEDASEARRPSAKAHRPGHEPSLASSLGCARQVPENRPEGAFVGDRRQHEGRLRRFFTSVHVAVAVVAALMLVSGHFATAHDSVPQHSAAGYTPNSGADAALDLIAAMALADAVSWVPVPRP